MTTQSTAKSLNTQRYREALRLRIVAALGPAPVRRHSLEFGVNHETLRRWLHGGSPVPAWFVAQVALNRGIDPAALLLGAPANADPAVYTLNTDRVDSAALTAAREQAPNTPGRRSASA